MNFLPTKLEKNKSLPMTTLTSCRGLYLPYKQNPDAVNRTTLVVDNRFATITITPTMMLKRINEEGVVVERMVPVNMPNQTTAAIVDAIMKTFIARKAHSNGAIEVLFSPYAVLSEITRRLDAGGEIKQGTSTNYAWLKEKLREIVRITADIKIKAGGGMTESAILSQFKHPDDEGYDLPSTNRECALSKHGEVRNWSVTFAPGYAKLFLSEVGVNFPTLLPVLNSMNAESAAIARYCMSNNFIRNEPAVQILEDLGMRGGAARTMRNHLAKVRKDESLLSICGIRLSDDEEGRLLVSYEMKALNRDGQIVWFTKASEAA